MQMLIENTVRLLCVPPGEGLEASRERRHRAMAPKGVRGPQQPGKRPGSSERQSAMACRNKRSDSQCGVLLHSWALEV